MRKRENTLVRILGLLLALTLLASMAPAALAADAGGRVTAPRVEYQSRYQSFNQQEWTGADNQKMVQIARAQLGRFAAEFPYTEAWCADFVTDTAIVAGIPKSVIPWGSGTTSAYVPSLSEWFSRNATEYTVEEALPGDIVMFDWDREDETSRSGDYRLGHVALVVYYDKDTGYLTYIGGNQGKNEGSKNREVTEEYYNTNLKHQVARIYRPKYATRDDTPPLHNVEITVDVEGVQVVEDRYIEEAPKSQVALDAQARIDAGEIPKSDLIQGDGPNMQGSTVELEALQNSRARFLGWYDSSGSLISGNLKYSFQASEPVQLSARFVQLVPVTVRAGSSGKVTGAGNYAVGDTATLTAKAEDWSTFEGWYTSEGTLLSQESTYSFQVEEATELVAKFSGDVFEDVTESDWFRKDVARAKALGIVNGLTETVFGGREPYNRAMAAVMLYRIEKPEGAAPAAPFTDLEAGRWYVPGVNWAYSAQVVKGMSPELFAPEENVRRQDFFTMVARYMEGKGLTLQGEEVPFSDREEISGYALEAVQKLYAIGLVQGDSVGTLRPQDNLNRAEGTAVLLRMMDYMQAQADSETDETAEEPPADSETDETAEEPPADSETDETAEESPADSETDETSEDPSADSETGQTPEVPGDSPADSQTDTAPKTPEAP